MKRLTENKPLIATLAIIAIAAISILTFLERQGAHDPAKRYEALRGALERGDFRAANTEASEIILVLADRTNEGWLGDGDVERLPCADIVYMDMLFSKASGGKFGLTAQRQVFDALPNTARGEKLSQSPDALIAFGEAVGWRDGDGWKTYDQMDFSPETAPKGHLPVFKPEDKIRAPFKSRTGRPQKAGALFDLIESRLARCTPDLARSFH